MGLTLVQAWKEAKTRLEAAGIAGPVIDARLLVEAAAEATRVDIVTDPYRPLTTEQEATLADYLARREKREPVSHILGRKGFWKIMLQVTPDVLTPRPDTETVVEVALREFPEHAAWSVLDLGVGSGAILLSILAERPAARGLGVEASEEATTPQRWGWRAARPCCAGTGRRGWRTTPSTWWSPTRPTSPTTSSRPWSPRSATTNRAWRCRADRTDFPPTASWRPRSSGC
jgi:hypothetical protein